MELKLKNFHLQSQPCHYYQILDLPCRCILACLFCTLLHLLDNMHHHGCQWHCILAELHGSWMCTSLLFHTGLGGSLGIFDLKYGTILCMLFLLFHCNSKPPTMSWVVMAPFPAVLVTRNWVVTASAEHVHNSSVTVLLAWILWFACAEGSA